MKMRSAFLTGLVFSAMCGANAFADTMFNFSFAGAEFSGSGVFTTVSQSTPGEYLITGVTGTTNGKTITGVEPAPSTNFNNDNLLFYPGTSAFDLYGVTYALSTGAEVNLFHQGSTDKEYLLRPNGNSFLLDTAQITVTPAASAVPEPESLLLLGTGALGMVGVLRRRLLARV